MATKALSPEYLVESHLMPCFGSALIVVTINQRNSADPDVVWQTLASSILAAQMIGFPRPWQSWGPRGFYGDDDEASVLPDVDVSSPSRAMNIQ